MDHFSDLIQIASILLIEYYKNILTSFSSNYKLLFQSKLSPINILISSMVITDSLASKREN